MPYLIDLSKKKKKLKEFPNVDYKPLQEPLPIKILKEDRM